MCWVAISRREPHPHLEVKLLSSRWGEAGNPVLKSLIARRSALSRNRDIVSLVGDSSALFAIDFLAGCRVSLLGQFPFQSAQNACPELPDRAGTGQACRWVTVHGAQPMTKSQEDSTGDRMVWDPRGGQTWEVKRGGN
jgi:hypothetical protein